MYKTGELAEIVGCSTKTIRQKVNNGEITVAQKVNSYNYFDDLAIKQYFRSCNVNACNLTKDSSSGTIRKVKCLVLSTGDCLEDYVLWQYLLNIDSTKEYKFIQNSDSAMGLVNIICNEGVFDTFYSTVNTSYLCDLLNRLGVAYVSLDCNCYHAYQDYNIAELVKYISNYQIKQFYSLGHTIVSDLFKINEYFVNEYLGDVSDEFAYCRFEDNLLNMNFFLPAETQKVLCTGTTKHKLDTLIACDFPQIFNIFDEITEDKSLLLNTCIFYQED